MITFFSFLLPFFGISMSTDINCSYEYFTFIAVGYTYHCDIRYSPNIISEESAVINQARGTHESYKNDDDVTGLYSSSKTIAIFPRGLEKIFKNLKLISINYGRLSEIHQSDLKPFPKLQYFSLPYNNIKIIEKGLFEYNPELAYISFSNNDVHEIYPEVFSRLKKLNYLVLDSNSCIDRRADDSLSQIKDIIKDIANKCTNTAVTTTTTTEWPEPSEDVDEYPDPDSSEGDHSVQHTVHIMVIVAAGITHAFLSFL